MSSRLYRTLGLLALAASAGAIAHRAQLVVDAQRLGVNTSTRARVMPDPAMLRAAALGQPTFFADLFWVRAALTFTDIIDHPVADGPRWLQLMLRSVVELDPTWRTPYFYGGSMLRVVENIDGSDEIFAAGMAALPEDPYFPFSLGMNAYLYREDAAAAAEMLAAAAELPGAPPWYRAAAAGFLDEHGQRKAALAYLKEQLDVEEEPAVREALQTKYLQVLHDELSASLTEQKQQIEQQRGAAVMDLRSLGDLPPDPLGAEWIVAPDGVIRSQVKEDRLVRALRDKERGMLTRPH